VSEEKRDGGGRGLGHPMLGTRQPEGTMQGCAVLALHTPGGVEGGHSSG